MKPAALLVLLFAATQSACVAIGYSSGGDWFLWPGGLGLLIIVLIVFFVFRRA
jgi:hypothetical protein